MPQFYILYSDALRYHNQFMQNAKYRSIAKAVETQDWFIDGRWYNPMSHDDLAIVFCNTVGVDNNNRIVTWEGGIKIPDIKIQASTDTPKYLKTPLNNQNYVTTQGFFNTPFVQAVLFYVYPHILRGLEPHLFGFYEIHRNRGFMLRLLLVDFYDKDKLLRAWEIPKTDRQSLLKHYFPNFRRLLAQAMKKHKKTKYNVDLVEYDDGESKNQNEEDGMDLEEEVGTLRF